MNICLCSVIAPETIGGAGTFNRHFIDVFRQHNGNIIFLSIGKKAEATMPDTIRREGNITRITLNQSYYAMLHQFKKYFRPGGSNAPGFLAAGYAMRHWLQAHHTSFGIDIIEVSDGGGIGIFLADATLPPVVLGGHGSNLQIARFDHTAYDEQGTLLKTLERLSYLHCDGIITHSQQNGKDLAGFSPRPIFVATIPFQPSVLEKENESDYGMVAGSLRYLKGPVLLSEALKQLAHVQPPINIRWFGPDSESIKGYESVAAYLQQQYPHTFNRALIWKGAQAPEMIRKQMATARFVVVPSIWETFSYTALEAASAGKALLLTKSTGAAELFTHGMDALVVEPEKDALAEAILQLHYAQDLRKKLGMNAAHIMATRFNATLIAKERVAVYQEINSNRNAIKPQLEESIAFTRHYLTPKRKIYFAARKEMKKLYLGITGKKNKHP